MEQVPDDTKAAALAAATAAAGLHPSNNEETGTETAQKKSAQTPNTAVTAEPGRITPPTTPPRVSSLNKGDIIPPPPKTPPSNPEPIITPASPAESWKHRSVSSTDSTLSAQGYHLRPPAIHRKYSQIFATSETFALPDLPWLCGTWHITHTTLPTWKDKRNVRVTFTRIDGDRLENVVTYQEQSGRQVKKLHGVDHKEGNGIYVWHGEGLGNVSSQRWEVLGWGGGGGISKGTANGAPVSAVQAPNPDAEQWLVTYIEKTEFNPSGVDIYSRKGSGLSKAVLEKIIKALKRIDKKVHAEESEASGAKKDEFQELVEEIHEVQRDLETDEMIME